MHSRTSLFIFYFQDAIFLSCIGNVLVGIGQHFDNIIDTFNVAGDKVISDKQCHEGEVARR